MALLAMAFVAAVMVSYTRVVWCDRLPAFCLPDRGSAVAEPATPSPAAPDPIAPPRRGAAPASPMLPTPPALTAPEDIATAPPAPIDALAFPSPSLPTAAAPPTRAPTAAPSLTGPTAPPVIIDPGVTAASPTSTSGAPATASQEAYPGGERATPSRTPPASAYP